MILRPGNKYDNTVLNVKKWLLCCVMLLACITAFASGHNETRKYISLNENWKRASGKDSSFSFTNAEKKNFDDKDWHTVNVPDNVNTYEGVQRLKHNDFHGDAWYRKIFSCAVEKGKRYFLFFEGVFSFLLICLLEVCCLRGSLVRVFKFIKFCLFFRNPSIGL